MTDKITMERETLERLVRWIGGSRAIIETDLFNDLRAALPAIHGGYLGHASTSRRCRLEHSA